MDDFDPLVESITVTPWRHAVREPLSPYVQYGLCHDPGCIFRDCPVKVPTHARITSDCRTRFTKTGFYFEVTCTHSGEFRPLYG